MGAARRAARRHPVATRLAVAAFCALVAAAAVGSVAAGPAEVPLRTHSLRPPFLGAPSRGSRWDRRGGRAAHRAAARAPACRVAHTEENLENRYWDFGGSTVVSTNKYIRLTPDRQSKTGWLWSKTVRAGRASRNSIGVAVWHAR